MRLILLICIFGVSLAACGAPASTALVPTDTPPAATNAPTVAAATVVPEPTVTPASTVVPVPTSTLAPSPVAATNPVTTTVAVLERSGGVAGKTETFTITSDGAVLVKGQVRTAADLGAVAALQQQIEASGIYAVAPGRYLPAAPCCDRFHYTLTLTKDGQQYQYITSEGADMPGPLAAVLSLVLEYTGG